MPGTSPPKRQRRGRTSSRAQTRLRPHSLEGICLRPGRILPLNHRQILGGSNTVHYKNRTGAARRERSNQLSRLQMWNSQDKVYRLFTLELF
ncbi:hypothetical protein PoB_007348400 [Plakobranchus ocellatus]|uniref:Uncharacterized protein n=1 Tax=Plakobranchus ocellatus TaxID=259542 RepID=A0AAV4DSL1_9GAST|nr:hypothetical protein PoB_007348400 [Plakobranchus ocellatus]